MNLLAPWEQCRYLLLDRLAARSARGSDAYTYLVARIEEVLQPDRRRVATTRIAQALQIEENEARAIYRNCLASEAREEADSARLRLAGLPIAESVVADRKNTSVSGPCIFISMHWGSPMLAFLYLRSSLGLPVRLIGRPLDEDNPLPPARKAWGRQKVAWMESLAESSFIPDDGRGALEARHELLEGRSIFASIDVPATTGQRSRVIDLFGEQVVIASGLLRLAALMQVPLVPVLGHSKGHRIHVQQDTPIPAGPEEELAQAVGHWIRKTLRRQPGEWWLWPFLSVENP